MGPLSSSEVCRSHEAVIVTAPGQVEIRPDVPLPPCGAHEVIVEVSYVALNPADQKGIDLSPAEGARLGSDFSGVVCQMGASVDRSRVAVGDRVCGAVPSNNAARPGVGAFAEYVVAHQDFVLQVPSHMAMDEAATLPIGALTCGVALYKEMGLTPPATSIHPPQTKGAPAGEYVLVYGASTSTGCLAMQLLQLCVNDGCSFSLVFMKMGLTLFSTALDTCHWASAQPRILHSSNRAVLWPCTTTPTLTFVLHLCDISRGKGSGMPWIAFPIPFPCACATRVSVRRAGPISLWTNFP